MAAIYIDVSHHDRNRRGSPLDWAAIATSTGQGEVMCARASYGDPDVFAPASPYFAEHQAGAKAAGYSCRGGYHNLIHGDAASIARQVDMLRRALDLGGCAWAMCDIEPYQELRDNGLWPRWGDVLRWHDRWNAVDSRVMVWYIGEWVWSGWLGSPDLRQLGGPLVNAHYAGGDGTPSQIYTAAGGDQAAGWAPYGGRTPEILQYTSDGNVAGASGKTDVNAYRGSLPQLIALLKGDEMELTDVVKLRTGGEVQYSSTTTTVEGILVSTNYYTLQARNAILAELRGQQVIMEQLAAALTAGGGSVDMAAIDARLAELRAQVEADTRDAVADLAEGGAPAVRADA